MSAEAALFSLPVFSSLDAVARAHLRACARPHALKAGELLLEEGKPPEHVYAVTAGELVVTRQGHELRVLTAPTLVGMPGAVDGAPRTASVRAFSDVQAWELDAGAFRALLDEDVALARAVMGELAGELRGLHQAHARHLASYHDFVVSPNARMVTGAYEAYPFEELLFVLEDDARRLAALLPPQVRALPGWRGRFLVTVNFFVRGGRGSTFPPDFTVPYTEVTVFLPCLGPTLVPSVFCPELYLDNYLMISLGREVYGFPKRYGVIERRADGVDVSFGGLLRHRLSWAGRSPLGLGAFGREVLAALGLGAVPRRLDGVGDRAGAAVLGHPGLLPPLPLLVRRQEPEIREGFDGRADGLRVDHLVEIPFHVLSATDFHRLDAATARHFAPGLFGGRVVGAFSQTLSFAFGEAHTLLDYHRAAPRLQAARAQVALGLRRLRRALS